MSQPSPVGEIAIREVAIGEVAIGEVALPASALPGIASKAHSVATTRRTERAFAAGISDDAGIVLGVRQTFGIEDPHGHVVQQHLIVRVTMPCATRSQTRRMNNTGSFVASDANDCGVEQRPCSPGGIRASVDDGALAPDERPDPVPHIYLTHTHMFAPFRHKIESEDSAESVDEASEEEEAPSVRGGASRPVLYIASLLVATGVLFALGVLVGGVAWSDALGSPLLCVDPGHADNAVSTDDGDWVVAVEESV